MRRLTVLPSSFLATQTLVGTGKVTTIFLFCWQGNPRALCRFSQGRAFYARRSGPLTGSAQRATSTSSKEGK
jgi:hypothetical protein